MFGRKPRVKCFYAEQSAGAYAGRADLGYRLVPVDRIVGSVGRCHELDARFQPLSLTRARRQRLERIRRLVDEGAILPPVELYKLRDEYYVIDGNHRVAVAKENGQVEIDAHVIELLPGGTRPEDRLYLARRAFVGETGLENVEVSRIGGYERLREEIAAYRLGLASDGKGQPTLREAAEDWYRRRFEPVARMLAARGLSRRAGRTAGDLYLDLATWRVANSRGGSDMTWEEAVDHLEALYPAPSPCERLAMAWAKLAERARALLPGGRREPLPCAHAYAGADGAIYCLRAGRLTRHQPPSPPARGAESTSP